MSDTINEAIRLKSLVFWLDQVSSAEELSMITRFWSKKDFKGFKEFFPVCPYCKGSPAFDLTKDGEPVVIHGVQIERVQCYCLTLEYLSRTAPRWYESHYINSNLDDITPYDIPPGAAARTRAIVGKLKKFLLNPTRSALINGGTGSAKSHMLQSIKTEFGGFAVYITLGSYFSKLQLHREENNGTLPRFIAALTNAPILLLDDFGIGHQTDWSTNTLSEIIDSRYSRRRVSPTLMTTNLTLVEMEQVAGVSIGNMERILSRMRDSENSTTLTVLQDDYRDKKFKKEAQI